MAKLSKSSISNSNMAVLANCFAASSAAVKSLSYSATGAGGECFSRVVVRMILHEQSLINGTLQGHSGIPDVATSGFTTGAAYFSRDAALLDTSAGISKKGLDVEAATTITEECERLFCGALRRVFLGEGTARLSRPTLLMGAQKSGVSACLEIWDYVGGSTFRGFVTEETLVVFFEPERLGHDLKSGLMALIELADSDNAQCSQLVVCIPRHLQGPDLDHLTKDLGWVGFEPITLAEWTSSGVLQSDKWLFLAMDI